MNYTKKEILEMLGITESSFQSREKKYLETLGAGKRGRGQKAVYFSLSGQPLLPVPKILFKQIFGYRSHYPKAAIAYLSLFFIYGFDFGFSDRQAGEMLGLGRGDIFRVRKEFEDAGWFKPITQETFTKQFSERRDSKTSIAIWEDDKTGEKTKKYWEEYYRQKRLEPLAQGEESIAYHRAMIGIFHVRTIQKMVYMIRRIYKREGFYFDFLVRLDEWFGSGVS
jgi:hypothetical protein